MLYLKKKKRKKAESNHTISVISDNLGFILILLQSIIPRYQRFFLKKPKADENRYQHFNFSLFLFKKRAKKLKFINIYGNLSFHTHIIYRVKLQSTGISIFKEYLYFCDHKNLLGFYFH